MKIKSLILALVFAASAMAQSPKQDSTVQITMPLATYKELLAIINANIDSKAVTKQIFELFDKTTQLVQPADKPKEVPSPVKPKQ